jgi:hypothetical protein
MSGLTPLFVPKFPTKQERKEYVIAGPVLERLRQPGPKRAEPAVSSSALSPPSAEAQARAILLAAQKRDGTISAADLKWLSNFHAPERSDFESLARRLETEKLAKAICLVGKKRRGEISLADERRLADHFAEMKAIELLR